MIFYKIDYMNKHVSKHESNASRALLKKSLELWVEITHKQDYQSFVGFKFEDEIGSKWLNIYDGAEDERRQGTK